MDWYKMLIITIICASTCLVWTLKSFRRDMKAMGKTLYPQTPENKKVEYFSEEFEHFLNTHGIGLYQVQKEMVLKFFIEQKVKSYFEGKEEAQKQYGYVCPPPKTCPYDTDNDGNCAHCLENSRGCYYKLKQ